MREEEIGTFSVPYKVRVNCDNCGYWNNSLAIPKGQLIDFTPCPNCGCKRLSKKEAISF